MPLSAGARLGPYEIVAPLGAGGMGEVYRARDSRLGRDVAIKVLSTAFALDTERLHRFEQEARAAAALNHPNILAVFDIGQHDGAPFIVSELLEGETLRERLGRVPSGLPVRKAIDCAAQVAHGLAAAHEKGIVHRDLKPENLFVTADDRVKILDFGLAKSIEATPALAGASGLATTPPHTQAGIVLGTVGYMAPEQVRGLPADHRSDLFALGAVLYEMLTGRRAFQRETGAETMTAILKDEPLELTPDARQIPPALARIVERCLAKNPGARFKSADDLAFALETLSASSASHAAIAPAQREPSRRDRWGGIASALALAAVASVLTAVVVSSMMRRSLAVEAKLVVRLQLMPPEGIVWVPSQAPAVSPDGTRLALVGVDRGTGKQQIYLRPLNSLTAQPIQGTDRGIFPFWASDGQRLAFVADARLKTIDVTSGTIQDVCPVPNSTEPGIWVDDTILFRRAYGPVWRVSASGGTPVPATPFDPALETSQTVTGFLADRKHFVFGALRKLSVGSTEQVEARPLTDTILRAVLHAPWLSLPNQSDGHLLFLRETTLFAQALDGKTAQLASQPAPVAQAIEPAYNVDPISVQRDVLAYFSGASASTRLMWFDRQGHVVGQAAIVPGYLRDPRFSPDGSLLAVHRYNRADRLFDVLLLDLRRSTISQLTFGQSLIQSSWVPGRPELLAAAQIPLKAGLGIFRVPATEGGSLTQLIRPSQSTYYQPEVSADGQRLTYQTNTPDGNADIWVSAFAEPANGKALVSSSAWENAARFSPDSKWIAYQSNETGTFEIYVRSLPDGQDKQQISRGGGSRPVWRHDGRELFFLSPDGDIMAAAIDSRRTLEAGIPQKLFRAPIDIGLMGTLYLYDAHPDGQRFIILAPATDTPQPVNVILNWQSLLPK
jgi:serine/threonine protein kinase/Tol biopolymer transport system component